ncbi:patatin-like phospholipase family protein [candidate division WWE3 bacterium]|uniref:Patatin-like phospholipase family protein n=1 Tax=candidate division WWE3 bacterium TaxID=2053526 RepID=A0A7X9E762_UNCKA|nr:patatin-like phospholipase family protein [candidate division WWE3 bacterium]
MLSNNKRKKIGLALGSGGWKGIAHIGVIKTLVENNIPIDYIAGSSAGALIGGIYAALGDIHKIEDIINKFNKKDLFTVFSDPTLKTGVLKGDKIIKFIEDIAGRVDIEDLKIPFCAVATDLVNGTPVYIDKGRLSSAIRASSSVPLLFEVPAYKDKYLLDGGMVEAVPTEAVKKMGADIVIGVNLFYNSFPIKEIPKNGRRLTKPEILLVSYRTLLNRLAYYSDKESDISIGPIITAPLNSDLGMKWFTNFIQEKGIVKAGEEAALKEISKIKKLMGKNK